MHVTFSLWNESLNITSRRIRGTVMSRFHQRLNEDLQDPEFAEAFYDMSVDIVLLQVLEEARKALNISEKELARRMGVQRPTVTPLLMPLIQTLLWTLSQIYSLR